MYDLTKLAALEARYDGPIPKWALAWARIKPDEPPEDDTAPSECNPDDD